MHVRDGVTAAEVPILRWRWRKGLADYAWNRLQERVQATATAREAERLSRPTANTEQRNSSDESSCFHHRHWLLFSMGTSELAPMLTLGTPKRLQK